MDLGKVFNYEQTFELELLLPPNDVPTGVKFFLRSASSDEARAVQRKHVDSVLERQQRGKLVTGDAAIKRELEKAVSYVAGWDWGDNEYQGDIPEFNRSNVTRILDEQDWIFAQVVREANNIANFSQASGAGSAKQPSK